MLFREKLLDVSHKIESNTNEINQLLITVENLQAENKKSQKYLQELNNADQISESALEQLKEAFLRLKNIDPNLMIVLKNEVDKSLFTNSTRSLSR